MDFRLSQHAQEELQRRGIPRDFLNSILQDPQQILAEQDDKRAYQSQFRFPNGKTYLVRAIVADRVEPAVVVTIYRTSRIAKYWRTES